MSNYLVGNFPVNETKDSRHLFRLDLQLFLVFNTITALYLSQYAILEAEFGFIPLIPTQRVVQRLNISRSCAWGPNTSLG